MAGENLVSIKIPTEQVEEIRNLLKQVEEALKPYLIALSPTQKKELPKMGDRTVPFINKILQYIDTNPEFVPTFMDAAEMKTDVAAVNTLMEFFQRVSQLHGLLNDTISLSGSEAYQAGLKFYGNLKQSARAKVPGAQVIFDDLKTFFAKTSAKAEPETQT